MAKLIFPAAKRIADTMPSPERTAAPSSMYGGKAGSGMARKNVPATSVRVMMRAAVTVHKPVSGKPHGQRPYLDARARRSVRRAGGIVEGDVRHAVRAARLAVMGLEDERLFAVHVREPIPSMLGSMCEHEALERPFRLARPVEHGIGRDEVGGCDRARITHRERDVLRGRRDHTPDVVMGEAR